MYFDELAKELVGSYYIDKYNLDSEDSYTRVTYIYRVNAIEPTFNNGLNTYKLHCTKISICSGENKKTGKKFLIECGISDTEVVSKRTNPDGSPMNAFESIKKTNKETWDSTVKELISTVCDKSGTLITFQQYCDTCLNKDTENCRFCCKEGENEPSYFHQK